MIISLKHQKILFIFLKRTGMRSSAVHAELTKNGETTSLVTTKRTLAEMVRLGILAISGLGPGTKYDITTTGRVFTVVDINRYCIVEPDLRFGMSDYNFRLFSELPPDLFSPDELLTLKQATNIYAARVKNVPAAIQKKELERLIIELSWKSSKIEGNTYTLLDTEKLLLHNVPAPGHDHQEATMILNHKDAFTYIRTHARNFMTLTRPNLDELHSLLVSNLSVGLGIRRAPVGVLGSKYRPLGNVHHIAEAVEALSQAVSRMKTPYAAALLALLGISYIQPFEDGNKRTARLMANALLIAHGCAPLSYRSVDENEYRQAMLVFYEINSLVAFKKIFIEQYIFAVNNYTV